MKKIFLYIFVVLVFAGSWAAWLVFGPATSFESKSKFLFIRPDKDVKTQVLDQMDNGLINHSVVFDWLAANASVWEKVKPGRFEIKKDENLFNIVRMLRNNTQSPVRLIINKWRVKEDFARQIARNFDIDSATAMQYFLSNDSLKTFNVDTNTLFTLIIPDTYFIKWNSTLPDIIGKLQSENDKFWQNDNRLQRAADAGLTPQQVYTIASIIEEETNKNDEKGNVASVYINRWHKGMALGADPTIKYALRDFSIKRILYGHLKVESPYNTYRNKGLPPGPVCTPSKITIDAVLDAPRTDYLFFVAKSDFSGYHHFSTNYAEHEQYAKAYQHALDEWMARKQKQ
ncbi:endolytic transglycosylase MltG [Limnovirga soli]|nr:endolytic transglycosylase MltG [Limnovirga soli]